MAPVYFHSSFKTSSPDLLLVFHEITVVNTFQGVLYLASVHVWIKFSVFFSLWKIASENAKPYYKAFSTLSTLV